MTLPGLTRQERAVVVLTVLLVALVLVGSAWAQGPAAMIAPDTQAARDQQRVRILERELADERDAAAQAAVREIERTRAGDHIGAQEASADRLRHASNIIAIERELRGQVRPVAAEPARPKTTAAPAAVARPQAQAAWDVFRHEPLPSALPGSTARASVPARSWDIFSPGVPVDRLEDPPVRTATPERVSATRAPAASEETPAVRRGAP